MKLLMMSMLLLSFLPVICSGHRTPPGRRTPYLSRDQFRRICEEIADLKKADEDLKKANEELIKANDDLKKADEYLKKANEELIKANDDLKKADEELIRANEGLKKDNEDLKEATTDLQNRIFAIESSVNEPVDGHWTGWLSWSGCYDVDGTGQKTRQRFCLDPRPSNGGTDCVGMDTEQMECELPGGEEFKSAFAVSDGQISSPDADPSGVIAWSSAAIKTNIGGNFDPATGLYTAPYDGTYAFHANIYKEVGVSDGVYCEIVLGDGTRLADVNVPNTHGFHVGSGSTVIHLAQGDTVAVDCQDFEKVDSYSSWMGYLVMAD